MVPGTVDTLPYGGSLNVIRWGRLRFVSLLPLHSSSLELL